MAYKRDLFKKAHYAAKMTDPFCLADDVICHDEKTPYTMIDHGPDEEEEEYEDDDDYDDEDDDDDEDDEDDDDDEDDEDEDEDVDEEDNLRDNKTIHFTEGFSHNPCLTIKMKQQFCRVQLVSPTRHQRTWIKSARKGESKMKILVRIGKTRI